MSKYVIEDTTLTNIGDAIRAKTSTSSLLMPEDMPEAIRSIEGGGSGEVTNPKLNDLVFGDYYYTQTSVPFDGETYDINIPADVISVMKAQKADMYVTIMRYRYGNTVAAPHRGYPEGRVAYSAGTCTNASSTYPYKQIAWFVTMSKETVEATPDGEDYLLCTFKRTVETDPSATADVYLFTFPIWGANKVLWRGNFRSASQTSTTSLGFPVFRSYHTPASSTLNGTVRTTSAVYVQGNSMSTQPNIYNDGFTLTEEQWNSKKLIYFFHKVSATNDTDATTAMKVTMIGDDKAFDPFDYKAQPDPTATNSILGSTGRVGIFKHSPDRRTLLDAKYNGPYFDTRGMIVTMGLTSQSSNYGMSVVPLILGYEED